MIHLPLAVPALVVLFCTATLLFTVLRARRLKAAWSSGIEVTGRCVGGHAVERRGRGSAGSSRAYRHVYAFTTPDGRSHRFVEGGGPATTVPGDRVVVRYPAGRPDRATALAPSRGATAVTIGVVGGFCGLLAAAAIVFAVMYEIRLADGRTAEHGPTGLPTGLPSGLPSGMPSWAPGAADFRAP
ncbi:DUF3592 domain-containing protein [Streptomyces bambusae]|uniref:DUF3592 domain-containing protein n=1 Tax=Streptomyces bambusae TaxID=1550616 RepID=A0ABS6ZCF0_9ACTN|nr:DUF3592 domain-containing protein [Streptomyces bambusae]MBW5485408.1 hypothetical protein [Streptomyces bambusae]